MKESDYLISRPNIYSDQNSSSKWKKNQCIYRWNRTEKKTHTNIDTWSLIKEWRQFNGERTVFSTNSAGTVRHPYAKKTKKMDLGTETTETDLSQKWTQNES